MSRPTVGRLAPAFPAVFIGKLYGYISAVADEICGQPI